MKIRLVFFLGGSKGNNFISNFKPVAMISTIPQSAYIKFNIEVFICIGNGFPTLWDQSGS